MSTTKTVQERDALRSKLRTYSKTERKAAVPFLPETPKSLAQKIALQKTKLQQVKRRRVGDAAQAARKKTDLNAEARKLASLVASQKAMLRRRKRTTPPGIKKIAAGQAGPKRLAVNRERQSVKRDIKNVKKQLLKPVHPRIQQRLIARRKYLEVKDKELETRSKLLKKGEDLDKPDKRPAASSRRPRLKQPEAAKEPTKGDVATAARILVSAVPKEPDLSEKQHRDIVWGVTERMVVRALTHEEKMPKDQALSVAAKETIAQDLPIIKQEVKYEGGLVDDPDTKHIEPYILTAAKELEDATAAAPVDVPTKEVSAKDLTRIEEEADRAIAQAAEAPNEPADDLRQDVVLADQPVAQLPLWRRPVVMGSAAVLAAAAIGYYASRRNA